MDYRTTVSIVIRTKNEAKALPKTLELIRQQSLKPTEIIVVDSGSTDGTIEIVKQQSDIKLIQIAPEEFTYGRSLNIGLKAAKGEIVVALSAHAFPASQQWLQNLTKHFDDFQVAGIYGKEIAHPDAWPPVERDCLNLFGNQLRIQTRADDIRDHIFSNANSAIRRDCWKIHKFDEMLSAVEDWEWARAMLSLEYKLIYEPEAAVHHSHNEPLLKLYRRNYKYSLAKKMIYGRKLTVRGAFENWYRAVIADIDFIIKKNKDSQWLLHSPIYHFFRVFGLFCPYLPNALWEPITERLWRVINLKSQNSIE